MNFKKLLSLLIAAALLLAIVPMGFSVSAEAEESREARIEKLISFSERLHEMEKRSAPEVNRAKALDDPFANARIIVKSAKALDYTGSIDHVNGYNDWHIIQYASPEAAEKAANEYKKLDHVQYAAPDAVMSITQEPHVDSFLSWGYGPNYVGAFNYNEWLLEDGTTVDELPEIRVGIIDTGIAANHPFLAGRVLNIGYDFANGDSNPDDDHYHGSHVAGTVVDGTLPNVKVIGIKVMDSGGYGNTSDIVNGFAYAHENGFQVANASLRGPRNDESFALYSDVINAGFDAGTVYCVASGNDGGNAMNFVPGSVDRAFTVASHGRGKAMSYFSNTGVCVDITAPGEDINSCVPGGGYNTLSGTSMATPHVAAACAMLKSYYPDLESDNVVSVIKAASVDEGLSGGGDGLLCVTDLLKYDVYLNGEDTNLHFTSPGNYPWIVEGGSVYSGNAGVNNSTSVLESRVRLGAYQRISFSYKVSSQQNSDIFRFKVNGQTVFETSGSLDWQDESFVIPDSGVTTLTWEFVKDASGAAGSDKAWLRNVVLEKTVSTVINDPNFDDPFEFMDGGSYPWIVDGDAAKSGNAGVNSSVSEVSTSRQLIEGIAVAFNYKTSCGAGDKLEFLVNGTPVLTVTSTTDWTAFEYEIPATGDYTLTLRYTKDGSGSVGSDCAWVKDFKLFYSLAGALNIPGGNLTFTSNGTYPWEVENGYAKSGNKGVSSSESTLMTSVYMREGDELSFRAKVDSESNYDKYTFTVNGTKQFERSGYVDWFTYTFVAPQDGNYNFVWKYTKDYSVNTGADTAYLDDVCLTSESGMMGDSNNNGTVEVADALLAMRFSMGLIGENDLSVHNADMDENGTISIGDAVVILRTALGLM
ncbi:MAG: S8 family serine peptidase [Clostridia bacterium]|nr:S8 family serine peptidase [Clostridia bacterium]